MPLNQQRMVGKCFDVRGCACVCACPLSPPPPKKKHSKKPSVYLAVSFNLCFACEREKKNLSPSIFGS